jgi:hypothetical protein
MHWLRFATAAHLSPVLREQDKSLSLDPRLALPEDQEGEAQSPLEPRVDSPRAERSTQYGYGGGASLIVVQRH